jgi:hypothetical protein
MANPKSNNSNTDFEEDGSADAWAATAIIAIVVVTVTFWLLGMK